MTKTEALKLALEAYLCREMPAGTVIGDPKWWVPKIANAIKEALAQQSNEQVEPVAWQERQAKRMRNGEVTEWTNWYPCRYRTIDEARAEACDHIPYEWRPLYTLPPVPTAQPKEQESKWLEMQCPICGDMAIPAPTAEPEQELVALDVTIEGDAAKFLASMLEPALDGDDPTPIRLMVGNGHSGYGIYAADDEYPEEGASLIANTTPPQRKPLTDEAAMFAAQHMFLEWNRRHDERLVKVAYEYGVFQKAIELYNEAYRIAKGNA